MTMKKILLAAALLLTLFAQGQQLEQKVIELAKADRAYSAPVSTTVVEEIKIQRSIDNFFKDIHVEKIELAEALENTSNVIAEAKAKNDQDTFKVWSYKKERLEKFKAAADKEAIDYRIVKHSYKSTDGKTIANFYFFDGHDNFIGSIGYDDYAAASFKFRESYTQAFELIMFGFKYKDTLGR